MRLEIYNLPSFETAVRDGLFKSATDVWLCNLPGITAKPRVHPRGSLYRNGRVWR